jgi:hypothetical protein
MVMTSRKVTSQPAFPLTSPSFVSHNIISFTKSSQLFQMICFLLCSGIVTFWVTFPMTTNSQSYFQWKRNWWKGISELVLENMGGFEVGLFVWIYDSNGNVLIYNCGTIWQLYDQMRQYFISAYLNLINLLTLRENSIEWVSFIALHYIT